MLDMNNIPSSVAIIMDGNGRWAEKRRLPRVMGHNAGMKAMREIVSTASQLGVKFLTVYAFSTENWNRSDEEINGIFKLLIKYVDSELDKIAKKHWDVEKREASAEMAGNVMEAVYQQNGSIIDALSSTKYDDQRIARDLPVKVAHKIGDAYDFRHDVAIVYTNSPYVIAIFTDHSNYDTISNISKDIYEVLK